MYERQLLFNYQDHHQSQQLLVNKSDTFEGCDIDTLRDKTFLNNINESTLLKLSPHNKNDF